jgi:cyclic pyranopterin phosphate synthase
MELVDPYNRRIDYLRVSVTDRCNLSCSYCKPRGQVRLVPHKDILRYEEIRRLIGLAAGLGISHVRITGGEPLVRRGVIPFIASLREVRGIEDISITTNGLLLGEVAEELRQAGIGRLNISLDTLQPARFARITGVDAWDRVWHGIEKAERLGFSPIKINIVPMRGVNDDEVADFARMTRERAIHVRFIELMPIGAGDACGRASCVPGAEVRAVIEREFGPLEPAQEGFGAGPARNFRLSDGRGIIGFISPISQHFCASCRRLRLTADGKIRPCLLTNTEIDVRSVIRGGYGDEELVRMLRLALEIKPDRHHAENAPAGSSERTMSAIGG